MPTNVSKPNAQKAGSPSQFAKAINNPTVLFCVIGFLSTLVVMLRLPKLGEIIAQYNQF